MRLRQVLQRTALLGFATLFLTAASSVFTWASASAVTAHYYMAVGDSYPFGFQPDGNWSQGYTDQLAAKLQNDDANLSLVNMACWGETTDSLIHGGCIGPQFGLPTKVTYTGPNASQLDTAKAFLEANGNAVKLVTVDAGINDLAYACFDPNTGDVDYTCVSQVLPVVQQNEIQIVRTLQSVASPATRIVLANSFDAYQNILPNTVLAFQQFNQVMGQVAQQTNVPLVDVAQAFHLNDYPNGNNPYLCPANGNALVWACTGGDSHPTTAGYALMAQAFYQKYQNL